MSERGWALIGMVLSLAGGGLAIFGWKDNVNAN